MLAARLRLSSIILLAAQLLPAAALAGPGDGKADTRNAARALAALGADQVEAGKYAEAIKTFEEAERLYHAPTILFSLARAYVGAGKLVEARAIFQRVVDEKLPAGASAYFVDAQRRSRDEIVALEKRIPTLKILVRGGGGRGLRLRLDDADLADWAPERAYPLDPGAHSVTVVPLGGVGVSKSAMLAEGAHLTLEIELAGVAPAVAPTLVERADVPRPWLLPSLMGYGLGMIGLGLGVGTGVAAMNLSKQVDKECPAFKCPASAASDLSAARGLGTASTVGFVLAGVGAVAGTVLLIVKPGVKSSAQVGLSVGPGSLELRGGW
jgi:hypothetical protein